LGTAFIEEREEVGAASVDAPLVTASCEAQALSKSRDKDKTSAPRDCEYVIERSSYIKNNGRTVA